MHELANTTTPGSAGNAYQGHFSSAVAGMDDWNVIALAHERSAAYGVTRSAAPDYDPLSRTELSGVLERNHILHSHAVPVMETLYEQIINTHHMVVLTDTQGCILHTLGDADFLAKADRVALSPGVLWSEQSKGTNAIGTAIAGQSPTIVHADQHYLLANNFLTCSASPIFDTQGKMLGVLDVTGDQHHFHRHTLALVRMSAQMIENQLMAATYPDALKLHFHSRPEFLGTLMEGMVCFTPDGRVLCASRSGLFQFGLSPAAMQTHTFSSLFGLPISSLMDHYRTAAPGLLRLCLPNGVRVFAKCSDMHLAGSPFHHASQQTRAASTHDRAAMPVHKERTERMPLSDLNMLNTGDPQLAATIAKLRKVIGRGISILITGETGTGKELLAQAIHNDSPRHAAPFIALNCASIPESLIESELFGYEDGAFTGARKKGNTGKILQANGGTLFLDEIGDMPLHLQARLLRVLQDRMVTPLGGTKSIPVNIDLICATNRQLRDMIARAEFRDDLYYRLNGLVVRLPALRERTDLDIVVQRILQHESEALEQAYTVAPEVMALFRHHSWPGNFRQLNNLLRTAILMTGEDHVIRQEHLPDDFLEDARVRLAQAADPAAGLAAETHHPATMEAIESEVIRKTLAAHQGNVSAAARALGVSRNTIYRKMQN
ncbi:sigma-54-dependent Fis family transcriptional regulator [Undibacterium griseum]